MSRERRKTYRRRFTYLRAQIAPPGQPERLPCRVEDISQTGARLNFYIDVDVPDEFTLWLSPDGTTSRHCKVVWRRGDGRIGVRFVVSVPGTG